MASLNRKHMLVNISVLIGLVAGVLLSSILPSITGARASTSGGGKTKYYLTKQPFQGNTILPNRRSAGACAAGYHFASLREIFDTSNLEYDTSLGYTSSDSGYGPPTRLGGWIRTGGWIGDDPTPGQAHCNAWTSNSPSDVGTVVFLRSNWDATTLSPIDPWQALVDNCDKMTRLVWCVEDP